MRIERDIDRTVSFRSSQGTTVRGTLSKLSRRNIVFEIYNPFSPIQTSEVLSDLKVRRGKDLVYQGDAVVTGVVTTSILVVVSATLVSKWSALDAIVFRARRASGRRSGASSTNGNGSTSSIRIISLRSPT